MKCRVIKLRLAGVAVPKYAIREQVYYRGSLLVKDTRDEGLNRSVKVAQLLPHPQQISYHLADLLYDPHLLWMNEGRFTLAGFERARIEGKTVEYAQSWLCIVEPERQASGQ